MRKTYFFPVLLLLAFVLSGCSALAGLAAGMGFDMNDYEEEEITAFYEAETPQADEAMALVRKLLVNTPIMTEFSGAKEGFGAYMDAVLNSLLNESYGRYTGNMTLLAEIAEQYPGYEIHTFIPVSDFEAEMYTLFGGSWKISHRSGTLFTYLEKAEGYTCVTYPRECTVETEFVSLLETEHTYRLTFRNHMGEVTSPDYLAIIIKRDDGTLYFRSISEKEPLGEE